MSHNPKLTMIGLYNWDSDIFKNLRLPDGVDKSTVINTFLLEHGESPLIYSNGEFVKTAFSFFSNKWYNSIERLIETMEFEYNPLHNFDRNEEYHDIEKTINEKNTDSTGQIDSINNRKTKDEFEGTENGTTNGTTENTVSAYNENTYQPDTKQINNQETTSNVENERNVNDDYSGTDKTKENIKENETNDRELIHTAHLFGNIGVTTSQSMLRDEVAVRTDINLYSLISELIYREFCIYTY